MDERDPREPQDDDIEESLGADEGVLGDSDDECDAMAGEAADLEDGDTDAPRRKLPRYTVHQLRRYEDVLGRRFCFTPTGRHSGREQAILAARRKIYSKARARKPERWTGEVRNWNPVAAVTLNPDNQRGMSVA